jgi:hypothetical protein
LWGKRLNAKDIHREMFPVYSGKYLSRKAVHRWIEKRGKLFPDEEDVEMEARKWVTQQSKYSYSLGFDALVKRWYKCIGVGGGYFEKYRTFSPRFEYHMFYVLYPFVTYLLTLPRKSAQGGTKEQSNFCLILSGVNAVL